MKKLVLFVIGLIITGNLYAQYERTSDTQSISVTDVVAIIIGVIALITFFVMAKALANISISVRNTERIISAWSEETGIGFFKPVEQPDTEESKVQSLIYDTNKGKLEILSTIEGGFRSGDSAFINGKVAPDGKYKLGFMWSVSVKEGKVISF